MTSQLYAWACPASFTQSPVDHTWVTAYDNRTNVYADIADVEAAQASYWYCWGIYHPQGGTRHIADGFLGVQAGEPALASCVAVPNRSAQDSDQARGTIFLYGIHGVCHQIANQVLFATRVSGKPLTVHRCRPYWISDFIYQTYGTNDDDWLGRANSCSVPQGAPKMMMTGQLPELFVARAGTVLADDPALLGQLLGLRAEVRAEQNAKALSFAAPAAGDLNQRNWEVMEEANRMIGETRFRQVFDHDPNVRVELVDPMMMGMDYGGGLTSDR